MEFFRKLFGRRKDAGPSVLSSQFVESESPGTSLEQTKSRNGPRRELVRVVLRETMASHGIPSDWIECRTLSVLTRQHKSGMHVQFLVRKGDQQLLRWVHAFQESFWDKVYKADPSVREWLFSVGWEFYGKAVQGFNAMPSTNAWDADTQPDQLDGDTQPPNEDDVASDLEILQALMSARTGDAEATEPAAGEPRRPR